MAGAEEIYGGRAQIEIVDEEGPEKGSPPTSTSREPDQKTFVTFLSDPPGAAFKVYDSAGRFLGEGFTPKDMRLSRAVYRIEA